MIIFNERTGTPFTFLEYPTDIVLLVLLWRLRYTLRLRDLAEMVLERGMTFTSEALREWDQRFPPLVTKQWQRKRPGQVSPPPYPSENPVIFLPPGKISRDAMRIVFQWSASGWIASGSVG